MEVYYVSSLYLIIATVTCKPGIGKSASLGPHSHQVHQQTENVATSGTTNQTNGTAVTSRVLSADVHTNVRCNRTLRKPRRRRRYDYEDVQEWDDDDSSLNYEMEEVEEPNLLLKIARNWRQAGVRLVFLGAFLIMFLMICCGLLRVACKYWCKSLCDSCSCCCSPGIKQCCQYFYSDPMYEKVKELGDVFGIKISYAMYEKIKDHYIDDSQLQEMTNPLGF